MKKTIIFILLSILFLSAQARKTELDSILFSLNQTIDNKEAYVKQKEQRIADLKQLFSMPNITPEQSYDINTRLYNEYKSFIPDSAMNYLQQNIHITTELENDDWLYDTKLNLSLLYSVAGMFFDAEKLLESIQTQKLHGYLLEKYYESYKQIFYYYPNNAFSEENYNLYRDSLLALLDPQSDVYKIVYSEKLIHTEEYEKSRELLLPMFQNAEKDTHWYSVLAFSIGETYRGEKNYDMQKKYYALSAIGDIKNVIKENASMRALAIAFYETNDIEQAYKYIQQSMEDAIFSNARLRTMEVSQVFPIIEKSYQQRLEAQKNRLYYLILCIGFLSLFLIVAVVYVYIQLRKLAKARRSQSDANRQLHDLNKKLQESNLKMNEINKELSEANLLKETYISQFLDICSMYINKLEKYQNTLNKKAMERKLDELYKILKSKDMIDNEWKELNEMFDNMFLHLYPNFVEEFNALLQESERIELKPTELLNPELRIFALIRLGITDSSKIAGFLHYSATTIYNYRTRVRNKSAVPREEFENHVMKIGIISH
jgi:cell division protein FtsL